MNKLFFILSLVFCLSLSAQDVPENERNILISFYNQTNGNDWADHTNWATNEPVETWHGITVEEIEGKKHITKVHLPANNLTGELAFGDLPHLKILHLRKNKLTKVAINNFPKLEILQIDYNATLTEATFNGLPELTELSLNEDRLTQISVHPKELPKIQELHLRGNHFKTAFFENLEHLKWLFINKCPYLESLSISNLPALERLYVNQDFKLAGYLDLSSFSKLKAFIAAYTSLSVVNLKNGNNINAETYEDAISIYHDSKNLVKCVAVDNPDAAMKNELPYKNWKIRWVDLKPNYRADCSDYMASEEVKTKGSLKISNPVKDTLWIQGVDGLKSIEIYSSTGQLVKTILGNQGDVSSLPKGVYFLKINTPSESLTAKIIKQ